MFKIRIAALLLFAALGSAARADLSALIAVEPTNKKDGLLLSRQGLEAGLGKALGTRVTVTITEDLAEAMRASRGGSYDIFIAPAQVAASALLRGYELVGSTDTPEQYLLVGRPALASADAVKGRKLYLPQQDSIYTYMARGMLNASGLSFKDLGLVRHERYPQAGLTALYLGVSDATVVRASDWNDFAKQYGNAAKVLAMSTPVPGGFSVVMRKDLPAETRNKVSSWFASSATAVGLKPLTERPALTEYQKVAELGLFTPTHLPGAKVVTAREVQQLIAKGAVVVDTRTEREYRAKHIPGAVFAPYVEKSLKDVAFDAGQDDFSGLAKLDKNKPTVFACNGAECWKSYKASRVALQQGFKEVYWFRGGLPEWEAAGLEVEKAVVVAQE
ncbi:rhodanese-like domain-containing protein [Caldimonas thermodepolymerans]|uniref:rhodanese-like domain-containing protein n=1 Tax=Caldimonas thermodepolymerans TaxID=215580 RepID=UPI002235AEA0|nr:rhodanese-like domain-containing protein [Caldimonas thermodepolymerans]UZG42735.1 rhodanese-like domain-containing protein [Caldimonas thermodepolymerans]